MQTFTGTLLEAFLRQSSKRTALCVEYTIIIRGIVRFGAMELIKKRKISSQIGSYSMTIHPVQKQRTIETRCTC